MHDEKPARKKSWKAFVDWAAKISNFLLVGAATAGYPEGVSKAGFSLNAGVFASITRGASSLKIAAGEKKKSLRGLSRSFDPPEHCVRCWLNPVQLASVACYSEGNPSSARGHSYH